jgi:hypothetical protein
LRRGRSWFLKERSYPISCKLKLVALYRKTLVVVCCNGKSALISAWMRISVRPQVGENVIKGHVLATAYHAVSSFLCVDPNHNMSRTTYYILSCLKLLVN